MSFCSTSATSVYVIDLFFLSWFLQAERFKKHKNIASLEVCYHEPYRAWQTQLLQYLYCPKENFWVFKLNQPIT